jgi:hypothetical protein
VSRVKVRPITVVLLVLAIVFAVCGIIYFTTAAQSLPSFFPGHAAHSAHHHIKHGLLMIVLALLALAGAWFTTAPEKSST